MSVAAPPVGTAERAVSDSAPELARAALALARRFAAGATMWCVSPEAPSHAHHAALEFVHPVIVGKKSLPAVAVDGDVDRLRLLVRAGDVLLLMGATGEAQAGRLLRRGEPWGVLTVALDVSDEPGEAGRADHVVGVGTSGTDGLMLAYHLLWELTHVVFEHPGLLAEPEPACTEEVCITCADDGQVVEVLQPAGTGRAVVCAGGARQEVDTSLVGLSAPGDLLLVHAGVAISRIDEATP